MDNYQLNPSISVSTYQKTIVIVEFIVILLEKRCIKNKDNKESSVHTIQKCKKIAGQNTFQIWLLNDANMIGEH